MIYDFQAREKKEVLDAKFGSLNKIFENCSCLNGFRYVSIFFKTKRLSGLAIRLSYESKNGEN